MRILDFSDRLLKDQRFSKENFDNIMTAIDQYESYCDEHEGFKNNVAKQSIAFIKKRYDYCLNHSSFLAEGQNYNPN